MYLYYSICNILGQIIQVLHNKANGNNVCRSHTLGSSQLIQFLNQFGNKYKFVRKQHLHVPITCHTVSRICKPIVQMSPIRMETIIPAVVVTEQLHVNCFTNKFPLSKFNIRMRSRVYELNGEMFPDIASVG